MRDWREHVQQRLSSLSLPAAKAREVVEELASHLEETYAASLAAGLAEATAFERTASEVQNWMELRREILSAKQEGKMHDRIKQIWIPALVTFLSAYIVLALMQWAGIRLIADHPGDPRGVMLFGPWILSLPFIGAAGAYLARRAQSARWHVYFAITFPALVLGAIFLLLFLHGLVVNSSHSLLGRGIALGVAIVGWVILPVGALSLGAALQGLGKRIIASR